MKSRTCALINISVLAMGALAQAQDQPQFAGPQEEHQWLQQFVGEWEAISDGTAGPEQPSVTLHATISSRMLGDLWVVSEMKGEVDGQTITAIQTIGYDPAKKKYVGTWVDSMMNILWHYEGWVDETGKILTLEAEGPNFSAEGKATKFRDIYEFKSADHVVMTSSMLGEDGQWVTFMTGNSRRKESAAGSSSGDK